MSDTASLISEGQDSFISIGMPGSLNFRGLVSIREESKQNEELKIANYEYSNQGFYCRFDAETDKTSSGGVCNHLWEKYSYLGMSHVMIQRYMNQARVNLIAAGAPREDMYGVVRLFELLYDVSFGPIMKKLNMTLNGPYKGSYFGFSIASVDVNGDKVNDLVVGAPYYSTKYEPNCGAVYIYLNDPKKGFSDRFVLNFTGTAGSLFGHAISAIGDIDNDGFGGKLFLFNLALFLCCLD